MSSQGVSSSGQSASQSSPASEIGPAYTGTARQETRAAPFASATVTLTQSAAASQLPQDEEEILQLTLRAGPSVRWDENVVDNEGMGRKSSKRCCIFHKQRAFGESSTDSSDYDSDRSASSKASNGGGKPKAYDGPRKIARPKNSKKVPDYQRFHA